MAEILDHKWLFAVRPATHDGKHVVSLQVLGMPIHETPGGKITPESARNLADELRQAADAADEAQATKSEG
jgi:hypothetical protein